MQYTTLLASTLLATLAAAQSGFSLGDLPNCGKVTCLLPAFTASKCDMQDLDCLCTSPQIRDAVTCIRDACEGEDLTRVFAFANTACQGHPGFPIAAAANTTTGGGNSTNGTGGAAPTPSGGADDEPNAAVGLGVGGLMLGGVVGIMGFAGLF